MWQIVNNRRALDEIVFRGRNKAYGAYVLRTEYDKTLCRALLIVLLGSTFFSVLGWFITREVIPVPVDTGQAPVLITTPVNLSPPSEINKLAPAPKKVSFPPEKNNNAATAYTVAAEDGSQKDTVITASEATEGPVTEGSSDPGAIEGGTGSAVIDGGSEDTKIFNDYETVSPEFEGGLKALRRFISDRIRHPGAELPESSGGRVVARFVVDEEGRISAVTIKHSGGEEFDNEVLRVVRMLPAFKTPGKMNGRPVKVYYDLPVKFQVK